MCPNFCVAWADSLLAIGLGQGSRAISTGFREHDRPRSVESVDSQDDSQHDGQPRTKADGHGVCELPIELQWTLTDGCDARPAIFKTVCGRP
jgi:hypothetical protein